MATPINTRILLRNDTLANWESSSLALGKGEVAIATLDGGELAEVRVGTGSSTWADALKLNIGTEQVSGLTDLISSLVGDGAKKYQVVANGANSWKLQEAALSGGDWTDVADSTWTVDFTAINNAISGLTADVDYLSGEIKSITSTYATKDELTSSANGLSTDYNGKIDATNATLNTVSSDYVKATDFAALSIDTGLSAASASNPVATKKDIADLASAMHFRGAVTPNEGETDAEAIARVITEPASGDIVIVTTTSKEYVYNGTEWIELGDEVLYATKAEVASVSAELTSDIADITADVDYLSGEIKSITSTYATKNELTSSANGLSTDYNSKINALSDTYATKTLASQMSAYALEQANDYTNSKVAGLSDYYTKNEVDAISTALSTDYSGKIKEVDDKLANYALSADVTSGIAAAKSEVIGEATDLSSADTINGAKAYAKNYTNEAVAALSIDDYIKHGEVVDTDLSGFFILSCGGASFRQDEPTTPIA